MMRTPAHAPDSPFLLRRVPMAPSPDDAVSVSYRPENVCLKRTTTSPSMLTHPRTLLCRWHTGRHEAANRCHSANPKAGQDLETPGIVSRPIRIHDDLRIDNWGRADKINSMYPRDKRGCFCSGLEAGVYLMSHRSSLIAHRSSFA